MAIKRTFFASVKRKHDCPVRAYMCVRPCAKAACAQRADTSVGPYRGSKRILYFGGVANHDCVQRAGHAPPLQVADEFGILMGLHMLVVCSVEASLDPTKVPDDPRTQERSVIWRSGLFIDLSFTHINPPTPGPGPQARCGKGVWSPEDQGDRCRVPRSFGPSGAGGEQLK